MNVFDKIAELEQNNRELTARVDETNRRITDLCDDIMSACRSNK